MNIHSMDHCWQLPKLTDATKSESPIAKIQVRSWLFDAPGQFANVSTVVNALRKKEQKQQITSIFVSILHFKMCCAAH